MLIEWLLDLLEEVLLWVADLFPESSWNPAEMFGGALAVLGDVNYFFPVAELALMVAAFLMLGIPFAVVTLVLWLIGVVRGASVRA